MKIGGHKYKQTLSDIHLESIPFITPVCRLCTPSNTYHAFLFVGYLCEKSLNTDRKVTIP